MRETRILTWMSGSMLRDRIRNEQSHKKLRLLLLPIEQENLVRWFGHVQRMPQSEPININYQFIFRRSDQTLVDGAIMTRVS